jgi:hypothetical protein
VQPFTCPLGAAVINIDMIIVDALRIPGDNIRLPVHPGQHPLGLDRENDEDFISPGTLCQVNLKDTIIITLINLIRNSLEEAITLEL